MSEEGRRTGRLVRETLILLVVAVALALVVKTLFLQAFYIPSVSMKPGLVVNDRILVEKPSYWFGGSPERGDVVVFNDPGDWLTADEKQSPSGPVTDVLSKIGLYPSGGHLVKRVIGVAGDTISCCDKAGHLSVNGVALDEDSFIVAQPATGCDGPMVAFARCKWTAGPVPAGRIFVMGDNRNNSADSSYHLCPRDSSGCDPNDAYVPTGLVVGKVFGLIWPLSHAQVLSRPDVFSKVPAAASAAGS